VDSAAHRGVASHYPYLCPIAGGVRRGVSPVTARTGLAGGTQGGHQAGEVIPDAGDARFIVLDIEPERVDLGEPFELGRQLAGAEAGREPV
jgi:hypothetical protein